MNDCIFCKIANGEIPSATIYEDEDFRAILDVSPASKGHALILPKVHFENLYDIPEKQVQGAYALAKKIGVAMRETMGCDGLNILQNNEVAAGQTVFHFHVHIIPRYVADGIQIKWIPGSLTEIDKEDVLRKLQVELGV